MTWYYVHMTQILKCIRVDTKKKSPLHSISFSPNPFPMGNHVSLLDILYIYKKLLQVCVHILSLSFLYKYKHLLYTILQIP